MDQGSHPESQYITRPPMTDRDDIGIIKEAVKIYYSKPLAHLGSAAVVSIPSLMLVALLPFMYTTHNNSRPTFHPAGFLFYIPISLISLLLLTYFVGSMQVFAAYHVAGRQLSWSEAISWINDRKLFWKIFLLSLLLGIIVAVGFVLCVIPGIIMGTLFCLAVPALVLGRYPIGQSLSVSNDLIKGMFWPTLGLLVLIALPNVVFYGLSTLLTSLAWGYRSTRLEPKVINGIISYLVFVFWTPVLYISLALYYIRRVGGLKGLRLDMFSEQLTQPEPPIWK